MASDQSASMRIWAVAVAANSLALKSNRWLELLGNFWWTHSMPIGILHLPILLATSEHCNNCISLLQGVRCPYTSQPDPGPPWIPPTLAVRIFQSCCALFTCCNVTTGGTDVEAHSRADRFHATMSSCGRDDDGSSTAATVPDLQSKTGALGVWCGHPHAETGKNGSVYGRRQTGTIAPPDDFRKDVTDLDRQNAATATIEYTTTTITLPNQNGLLHRLVSSHSNLATLSAHDHSAQLPLPSPCGFLYRAHLPACVPPELSVIYRAHPPAPLW